MDNNNGIIPGFDNDKDDSLTISLRKLKVFHMVCLYTLVVIQTPTIPASFKNRFKK